MTEKIATVFGLAHRCPLGARHPECPLQEPHNLSLKDRYEIISELPSEKIHYIVDFHDDCSRKREDI